MKLPQLSNRSIVRQAMVGAIGGWTLTALIETRRLSYGVNSFVFWSCLALLVYAATVRKTDSERARKAGAAISAIALVGFLAGGLCTAERLYFVNGATYPAMLTQGDLGTMNFKQLGAWQDEHKCFQGEHLPKEDGRGVFRCGGLWWPTSSTFYLTLDKAWQ